MTLKSCCLVGRHTWVICRRGGCDCRRGGRRGRRWHQLPTARSRREHASLDGNLHQRLGSRAPNVVVILSPGFCISYTIFGLSTASVPGAMRYFAPDRAFFSPLNAFLAAFSSSFTSSAVSLGTAVSRPGGGWPIGNSSCFFTRLLSLESIVAGGSVLVPTVHTRGLGYSGSRGIVVGA